MDTGVAFKISAADDASAIINRLHNNLQKLNMLPGKITAGFKGTLAPLQGVLRFLEGIGSKLAWIGGIGFGLATAGAMKLASGIIAAAANAQTLKARLQTIAGSGAQGLWDWAQKFATQTPFDLNEIIDAMTTLQSFDLDPTKNLRVIGDFAAAMGRSLSDTIEAVTAGMFGEWDPLKRYGIKPQTIQTYAAANGMPSGMDKNNSITNQAQVFQSLIGVISQRGIGGMARMMDTINGKWSNLLDAVTRFKTALGEAIAPYVMKGIAWLEKIVNWLNTPAHINAFKNWAARAFSDENSAKAAQWLDKVYNKAVDVWNWVQTDGVNAFDKILGGAKLVADYIKDKWIPLMETFGRIMIDIAAIKVGLGIIQAGAELAGVTRGVSIPVSIAAAAAATAGISAVGNEIVTNLGNRLEGSLARLGLGQGTNERGVASPPRGHFENGRFIVENAASSASPISDALRSLGIGGGSDPTQEEIARNTGSTAQGIQDLKSKQDSLLSQIYGGGDRLRNLAARYRNGSFAGALAGGQAVTINVNLAGGTPAQQTDMSGALRTFAKVLNPNAQVHIRRSRN